MNSVLCFERAREQTGEELAKLWLIPSDDGVAEEGMFTSRCSKLSRRLPISFRGNTNLFSDMNIALNKPSEGFADNVCSTKRATS
jgi:hypothetical protein